MLSAGSGAEPTAYGGVSCTNQFLTGLSAAGAASSCTSVTNAYLTAGTFTSITGVGTLGAGTAGTGFTLAGVTVTLGSDATGDVYYRASTGVLTRLAIGSTGNVLTVSGGLPAWESSFSAGTYFNQPATTNYWTDSSSPVIHRINDRVFIGGAANNSGKCCQLYITGTLTSGSSNITGVSSGDVAKAAANVGAPLEYQSTAGIASGTTIASASGTTIVMSANATSAAAGTPVGIGIAVEDWLENLYIPYVSPTTSSAQFAVLNTKGLIAILGGTRTQDYGATADGGAIAIGGYAENDNPTNPSKAWGGYFQVTQRTQSLSSIGTEIDYFNDYANSTTHMNPYGFFTADGTTASLWLGTGSHFGYTGAHAAIGILNNGSPFDKGIVFEAAALAGNDGSDSSATAAEALTLARNDVLSWYAGSGTSGSQKASISSTLKTTDPTQKLTFASSIGLTYNNANGIIFQIYPGTLGSPLGEGIVVVPGATGGGSPVIKPISTDGQSNLNLTIAGIGTGGVIVPGASANALAVGLNGTTNPAFNVDASTASQAAGFNVKGAATGGTVALSLIDSGSNTNLTINAKGTGTIGIGSVSTGAVTVTPALTLSAALTYGGVALSNSVTGTGSMVLSASPSVSGLTVTSSLTATGLVTLADLATQATNTVLVNATSGTASPTAQAVSSCSAAADALIWTTNTGFGCNASITAAAVPASGLTGTTLASGVVSSSLTSVGTIGTGVWQGTAVAVAYGGTNCTSASITCFNNVTGFSAAGTTGTTSTNLVFSASPTLTGTVTTPDSGTYGSGGINGSNIGATTPGTAQFTTLKVTGNVQLTGISGGTIAYAVCTDATGNLVPNSSANCYAGGSASAGGSPTQVQYNSGGSLAANASFTYNGTGTVSLGTPGSQAGAVSLANITSGTVTLGTVAGALGTVTASLPANTGTIGETNYAQTWSATQTYSAQVASTAALTVASAAGATLDDLKITAETTTFSGSTNITTSTGVNKVSLYQPTYTASASAITITNAATLYVAGAPATSSSGGFTPVITNAYALWVAAGASKFGGSVTVTGASLSVTGNLSAAAWTTSGVRYANVSGTLTDTTSSGTVATVYDSVFGGDTNAASSSTTYTNAFSTYFAAPVQGSNVTLTNAWALGADSAKIGTSNQLTVSAAGALTVPGTANFTGTLEVGGYAGTFPSAAFTVAALNLTGQVFSGGFRLTVYSVGTISSGTVTVDSGNGAEQWILNGGAFTLAAPLYDGNCIVHVINGPSAGTVTPTGFHASPTGSGDTFATTLTVSSAAVTVSSASPAVVTYANTFVGGEPVYFTASVMPTGMSANTIYYVLATGLSSAHFEIAATPGGTAINTSSTGTTVVLDVPSVYMASVIRNNGLSTLIWKQVQ